MIRLIDKNELKEWVDGWFVMNRYYHPYSTQTNIPVSELYDIVERMPTVNAVPVIRCKDCKYYTGYECMRSKILNVRAITEEDDYCSRAERKEE